MSTSNTQKPLQPAPTSSQTQQDFLPSDATMADAPDSPVQSSQSPTVRKESIGGGSSEKSPSGAPGSSWNSKKFHEEFERTMSGVLDKDWDHTKYGDVLLD